MDRRNKGSAPSCRPSNGTTRQDAAQQIALWSDRLRDISASGLRFSNNVHDRENYQAIQNMAMEMLALASGAPLQDIEPLREPLFSRPTPIIVGDAAVFNDSEQLLLIRRSDSGAWALPGGAMSVGETPAQGVAREALEETGVRCRPVHLVGVYDNRLCGGSLLHHLYVFLFLCRQEDGGTPGHPSHASEVLGTGWFDEAHLPQPLHKSHIPRIRDSFRAWRGNRQTFFDPLI